MRDVLETRGGNLVKGRRLDVTSVRTSSEERGLKQVRPSEVRVGGGAFWMDIVVNKELMSFTFLVK